MRGTVLLVITLLAVMARPAPAATVVEIFTDRALFDARLLGQVRVVGFDDLDTGKKDPKSFGALRYRAPAGLVLFGENGQFASRDFGSPNEFVPRSPANSYAPGPIGVALGEGGNTSFVTFAAGEREGKVAGFGVTFIDADFPGDGPSSFTVSDESFTELGTTGVVSGGDGSQLFRGIVAIDTNTTQPTPAIRFVSIQSGQGWPGVFDNEGVSLDDLVIGVPVPLAGAVGEVCDNCADDDGDGMIDRLDPECDAPATGRAIGFGASDPRAKAVAGCQKTIAKQGAAFVAKKLKLVQSCTGAVQTCLQTKPGDPGCLAKAQAKCAKVLPKQTALEDALRAAVAKGCGGVSGADVRSTDGLGFVAETDRCLALGSFLDDVEDLSLCVQLEHGCRAEQILSRTTPRARNLLALGGVPIAVLAFPCVEPGSQGSDDGLGGAGGKAVLKCAKALDKAALAFVKDRQKRLQKCAAAAFACVQLKPNDACFTKAESTCAKQDAGLQRDPKGGYGKARTAILKACSAAALPLADVLGDTGLGYGTEAGACAELANGSGVDTIDELVECVLRHHACRVDSLVTNQLPRADEMYGIGSLQPHLQLVQ